MEKKAGITSEKLRKIRQLIDLKDKKIISLLQKRFELVSRTVNFKKNVKDKKREKEILDKISKEEKAEYLTPIYKEIFRQSVKWQVKNVIKNKAK
jgi:chorismate mutase